MSNFRYTLSDELINWRKKHVISAYNQIGVLRFAFISEKPTPNQDDPANTFITRTFTSESDAVEWISSER